MRPRRGGTRDPYPMGFAIVVSHDCEWTKVEKWGLDYPLLVAPLRPVVSFETGKGETGHIRKNRVRFLFYLPPGEVFDDEYAADLTLIQPLTAGELVDERANLVTSLGPGLKPALQAMVSIFFTDRRPHAPGTAS